MKAKKLTKREWYLGAQWYLEPNGVAFRRKVGMSNDTAAQLATECYCATELDPMCQDDLYCMRAQYCLERAGIPAGKT